MIEVTNEPLKWASEMWYRSRSNFYALKLEIWRSSEFFGVMDHVFQVRGDTHISGNYAENCMINFFAY
jgi:hypothetical protein